MNYIFSFAVAAIRALSMFFAGKIILAYYDTQVFAAHAQLTQFVTVLLPISCGFTTLAIINACANSDWRRFFWILKIALAATIFLVFAFAVFVMAFDTAAVSKLLFGNASWQGALLIAPIAVALAGATSLATASLIGLGKGRWVAGADAFTSLCAVLVVAIAATTANIKWLIYSPLPVLFVGLLVAGVGVFSNRHRFSREKTALIDISSPAIKLRSYMMMSLAASAIAPAAIIFARSTLLNETGYDAATSFIAGQRLAALAVAPIPFYVYTFLSHYFASNSYAAVMKKIRRLQLKIFIFLFITYVVLTCSINIVTPIAFSEDVKIPPTLFGLVAIGEMARLLAAIQAQYMATVGRWKAFLVGDFTFMGTFLIGVLMGDASGVSIAGAYGLAGISYVFYITIAGNFRPKGISDGT